MSEINEEKAKHLEVLKIFDRRAKSSKLTLILLIYTLVAIIACVFYGVFYIKSSESASRAVIADATALAYKNNPIEVARIIKDEIKSGSIISSNLSKNTSSVNLSDENSVMPFFGFSNSEKNEVTNSISLVLINLSLMIFIGFVMKAIFIFIRYYMQLVADHENQKVAYILSKGDMLNFEKYLSFLRENNIQFEKTPNLPQEKIIMSLLNALNKNKNPA